jgi:hypothetical protein
VVKSSGGGGEKLLMVGGSGTPLVTRRYGTTDTLAQRYCADRRYSLDLLGSARHP